MTFPDWVEGLTFPDTAAVRTDFCTPAVLVVLPRIPATYLRTPSPTHALPRHPTPAALTEPLFGWFVVHLVPFAAVVRVSPTAFPRVAVTPIMLVTFYTSARLPFGWWRFPARSLGHLRTPRTPQRQHPTRLLEHATTGSTAPPPDSPHPRAHYAGFRCAITFGRLIQNGSGWLRVWCWRAVPPRAYHGLPRTTTLPRLTFPCTALPLVGTGWTPHDWLV